MKITKDQFENVINNNEVVLVDFFATWCGPCKMLAPVIEELSEMNLPNTVICKVDVDEERELANMFNISSIPTIIVFKNGKAERQALGYRTKDQLLNMMKF